MTIVPPIFKHLNEIAMAVSIETVWNRHAVKMAEYGFDRMLYATTRFRSFGDFGDLEDSLILTNHDKEYVDTFFGEGHYRFAPMVKWTITNTGFASWSRVANQLASGKMTQQEIAVLELNARYGIRAGFSISFNEISSRARGGIGLVAKRGMTQADVDNLWEECGHEILLLNNVMHLKISNLPQTGWRRPLTDRQREVLQWVADGKTVQDVAEIMGLNAATVEKHLRRARENLNVETTAQAVLKASLQNQFFI